MSCGIGQSCRLNSWRSKINECLGSKKTIYYTVTGEEGVSRNSGVGSLSWWSSNFCRPLSPLHALLHAAGLFWTEAERVQWLWGHSHRRVHTYWKQHFPTQSSFPTCTTLYKCFCKCQSQLLWTFSRTIPISPQAKCPENTWVSPCENAAKTLKTPVGRVDYRNTRMKNQWRRFQSAWTNMFSIAGFSRHVLPAARSSQAPPFIWDIQTCFCCCEWI